MKRKLLCTLLVLVTLYCNAQHAVQTTLNGTVKNANGEIVTLIYRPFLRGSLNPLGFNSMGTQISKEGKFTLKSDKILDGTEYYIIFNDKNITGLVLFEGDNINLNFDINKPSETLFATGKGAGKINMMHLPQFDDEFMEDMTPSEYAAYLDSLSTAKLALLNAVYKKEKNNKVITNEENREILERIINESPLSEKEYDFLKSIIELQKFEIGAFLEYKSEEMEGKRIDFSDPVYKPFNVSEYKKITSVNNCYPAYIVYLILRVEYLKSLKDKELYYENWYEYVSEEDFINWEGKFLNENFTPEVRDRYYSEVFSWLVSMGQPYDKYSKQLDYLQNNANSKSYQKSVDFIKLMETGLTDKKYNLADASKQLDKQKLEAILEKYNNKKNVLLVFWSAEFAGSSILNQIPSLQHLEKEKDLQIVYIGIDRAGLKNLWAARIIDNNWKGEHYFMPIEGNEDSLKKFSSDDIYAFCDGGATFSIITKNNTVLNKVENSYQLAAGKIKKYL